MFFVVFIFPPEVSESFWQFLITKLNALDSLLSLYVLPKLLARLRDLRAKHQSFRAGVLVTLAIWILNAIGTVIGLFPCRVLLWNDGRVGNGTNGWCLNKSLSRNLSSSACLMLICGFLQFACHVGFSVVMCGLFFHWWSFVRAKTYAIYQSLGEIQQPHNQCNFHELMVGGQLIHSLIQICI